MDILETVLGKMSNINKAQRYFIVAILMNLILSNYRILNIAILNYECLILNKLQYKLLVVLNKIVVNNYVGWVSKA